MPEWKQEIRERVASLRLAAAREDEIVAELAQHLEDHYQDLLVAGVTQEDALILALEELQGSDLLSQEFRLVERQSPESIIIDVNSRSNMIAGFWQDVR